MMESTLICQKFFATQWSSLFRVPEVFPFRLAVEGRVRIEGHAYRVSAGDTVLERIEVGIVALISSNTSGDDLGLGWWGHLWGRGSQLKASTLELCSQWSRKLGTLGPASLGSFRNNILVSSYGRSYMWAGYLWRKSVRSHGPRLQLVAQEI